MTSQVNSIFDIIGALLQGEVDGILPKDRIWEMGGEDPVMQGMFLKHMSAIRQYVPGLVQDNLMKGKTSWDVKVLNEWFKKNGFSIELTAQPTPDQEMYYVGSIYSHLLKWLDPGTERELRAENRKNYEGAYLKGRGVSFYKYKKLAIARLATKEPRDVAYMMPCDPGESLTPFDLLLFAKTVQEQMTSHHEFSAVHFPMVNLNVETDIKWIQGLWTPVKNDVVACVVEAKQQCKLKLNHKAAKAESATGMSISLEATSIAMPMKIDRPFLFWISRSGIPMPLFAAHVDYGDWANPGEIS